MRSNIDVGKRRAKGWSLQGVVPMGLSVALAAGLAFGPMAAFAEGSHVYEQATITITQPSSAANGNATFDAYKVFDADIGADDKASHVNWASDNVKTATLSFLDSLSGVESYSTWLTSQGMTQAGAHDNAQNAAEFISARIIADTSDSAFGGSPAAKVGGSFADRLARAIQGASPAVSHLTSSTSGVISGGTEGFYLIVTTPATIGEGEAGSAPMWIPMGGSLSTVQSKEAAPAVAFAVTEDKTLSAGGAADSNTGQDLLFTAVGTVPDNIGTYSRYHDSYVFTLPASMSTQGTEVGGANMATSSVKVMCGSTDITDQAFIGASGHVVTVDISDLTALEGVDVAKGTSITVTYRAHLDQDAVYGSAGQETTLVRTYTKDPVTLADVAAGAQTVKNFSYQVQILKIDKSNQKPLSRAGFTIATTTDIGDGSKAYYIQADGSLGETAHEFVTGEGGTIDVAGLDEGVYVIHESTVPNGYLEPDADVALTLSSSLDQVAKCVTFGASVTGGEAADLSGDAATMLARQDAAAGKAYVQAVNEKAFVMPLTGLKGNAAVYVTAIVLGLGGVVAIAIGAWRKSAGTDEG